MNKLTQSNQNVIEMHTETDRQTEGLKYREIIEFDIFSVSLQHVRCASLHNFESPAKCIKLINYANWAAVRITVKRRQSTKIKSKWNYFFYYIIDTVNAWLTSFESNRIDSHHHHSVHFQFIRFLYVRVCVCVEWAPMALSKCMTGCVAGTPAFIAKRNLASVTFHHVIPAFTFLIICNWHFRRHHQRIIVCTKYIIFCLLCASAKQWNKQNTHTHTYLRVKSNKREMRHNNKCCPTSDCHHFQDLVRTELREVKLWKYRVINWKQHVVLHTCLSQGARSSWTSSFVFIGVCKTLWIVI